MRGLCSQTQRCDTLIIYTIQVGQNIAQWGQSFKRTSASNRKKMADAVRGWYNEVKMGQLRFARHYTQLAWADTEELGCGIVVYKVGLSSVLEKPYCMKINLLTGPQKYVHTNPCLQLC